MPPEPAPRIDPLELPAKAEAVLTFLDSVGRRSEAELYLRMFQQLPKESFAIIAPGAPVIRQGQGAFAEQLRFLDELGLRAPVVLGLLGGTQLGAVSERLRRRLRAAGLTHEIHAADEAELPRRLGEELRAGVWPIVELAEAWLPSPEERLAWIGGVARELDTRKLVLLRRHGRLHLASERGLSLAEQHVLAVEAGGVSLVNLTTDADLILGHRLLRKDDARLLELVRGLLDGASAERLLVSITSPLDLLRELFTVKGSGTLVKRGSAISASSSYEGVDRQRLAVLFGASFGAPLREGFFAKAPARVFVEQDYRAAAIVQDTEHAPYLSKFAVDPLAQGEGLGRDLWQVVEREFPRLFWRTRAENPIAAWYSTVCDGLVRTPRWHVFWRGLEPLLVPSIVAHAETLGDDFER